MQMDTFYGDLVVKLIWRLSDDLICHVFSVKMLSYILSREVPL